MTRLDLARKVREAFLLGDHGDRLTLRESQDAVDEVFEQMRRALARGENVGLRTFGEFRLQTKRERPGRNPKTGESCVVTARKVVKFRAGDCLKYAVDKS